MHNNDEKHVHNLRDTTYFTVTATVFIPVYSTRYRSMSTPLSAPCNGRRANLTVAASDSPAPVPFRRLQSPRRKGRKNTSGAAHHPHRSRQERLRREHPAVARSGGTAAASVVGWGGLAGVAAV